MERHSRSFLRERNAVLKVSQLERKWQQILEEERRSYARNKKLLEDFDRVQQQIGIFSKKSDRLKEAKHNFEEYVSSIYPEWTKELKRLQETKRIKDSKPSAMLGDQDDFKPKKFCNSGYTLDIKNTIPKPTLSSTPSRNGTSSHEYKQLPHSERFRERNQKSMPDYLDHNEHLSYYRQVPFGHSSVDVNNDRNASWGDDGKSLSHGLPYFADSWYTSPRLFYGMPWPNQHFPFGVWPRHMFSPDGIGYPNMSNDYSRGDSYHPRMSSSQPLSSPDQQRNFQEYPADVQFGRHGNNPGPTVIQEFCNDPRNGRYDVSLKTQRAPGYFSNPRQHGKNDAFHELHKDGFHGNTEDTSKVSNTQEHSATVEESRKYSEEGLPKKGEDQYGDLKWSPDLRNSVGDREENDYQVNPRTFKDGKIATSDPDSGRVLVNETKQISHATRKSGSKKNFDERSGGTYSRKEETSLVNKLEIDSAKEPYNTESVSLPTIHDFEGDIKDIYSDLSESEQVSADDHNMILQPNDVVSPKSDERGSAKQNKGSTQVKPAVSQSAQVNTNLQQELYKEDLTEGKPKTSVVEDLLGDDASDFEVSGSEILNTSLDGEPLTSAGQLTGTSENDAKQYDLHVSEANVEKHAEPENSEPERQANRSVVDSEAISNHKEGEGNVSLKKDHTTNETAVAVNTRAKSKSQIGQKSAKDNTQQRKTDPKENISDSTASPREKTGSTEILSLAAEGKDTEMKQLVIKEKTFLGLLQVVDDDIEVSFSTELLYRNPGAGIEKKEAVLMAAESGGSLDQFDPAVISMVLLDQLPYLIRSSGKYGLISDELLREQKKCISEKYLRDSIDGSLLVLWNTLFAHFLKLIENNVMNAKNVAEIFAPCLISSECTAAKKAVSLLASLLTRHKGRDEDSQSTEEPSGTGDVLPLMHDEEQEEEDSEKSKSVILEELSYSSDESSSQPDNKSTRMQSANKTASKASVLYSEDFEDEKSIPLTETDAYQKMLSSVKISDKEDDVEDDLLGEATMSEANTSGQTKQKDNTQQLPRQQTVPQSASVSKNPRSSKSKPKLSLFSDEREDLGDSFGNESQGVLTASWKSSEMSLSPPLSQDGDVVRYVPTAAAGKNVGRDGKDNDKEERGTASGEKEMTRAVISSNIQGSKIKSRVQAGFWNHNSDTESEVDLQVSHGADKNNDDDDSDFDFYS